MRTGTRTALAAVLVLLTPGAAAVAAPAKKPVAAAPAKPAADAGKPNGAVPTLPGSNSKEPVNITADKLDFLNKENKLIYTGNVVVIQGDTTMKASVLRIDLQKTDPAAGTAPAGTGSAATPAGAAPAAGDIGPGQGSSVKHMDADGPVTLISKDQIGTGDHAIYDKDQNKVYLNGNVTLSQGTNVTQGDRLIYDMTSGQAQVFSGATNNGRVISVFTPGSGGPDAGPGKPGPKPSESKKGGRKSGPPKGEAAVD